MLLIEEVTSVKLEINLEILWMHLSSRLFAEIAATKILLQLTQSELGVFNYTNDQLQLGEMLKYCRCMC